MLTEQGYATALWVYGLAAVLALLLFNWWFLRGRSAALRLLLCLPLAAVLLTPAFIEAGGETLAPAAVVAGFQWFSQGPEAADHALRALLSFTASAFAVAVVLSGLLLVLRRKKQ